MVFIHPGAGWAIVLVNHALAIKESNKHDLASQHFSAAALCSIAIYLDASRWMIHFSQDGQSDGCTT